MCWYALWSFNHSLSSCYWWSRWLWVYDKIIHKEKNKFEFLICSYFAIGKDGTLQNQQTGIFRTNCVDCLDRTNVVQTLFSKRILEQQLKRYNVIKYNETIDTYKQLSNIFKNSNKKK